MLEYIRSFNKLWASTKTNRTISDGYGSFQPKLQKRKRKGERKLHFYSGVDIYEGARGGVPKALHVKYEKCIWNWEPMNKNKNDSTVSLLKLREAEKIKHKTLGKTKVKYQFLESCIHEAVSDVLGVKERLHTFKIEVIKWVAQLVDTKQRAYHKW